VVKLNLYLVDATQLPVVREVRDEYVNTQQPPASTAVEVRRLVRDDLLIEVEAVAVIASFQPMTSTTSTGGLLQRLGSGWPPANSSSIWARMRSVGDGLAGTGVGLLRVGARSGA
jgi:hypothetical protein